MSIVHFIESDMIFDINELYLVKIEEKENKCKIIGRFKASNEDVVLGKGTKEQCKNKLSKLIDHLKTDANEQNSPIQWAYGTYYDILCNLNNVDLIELGPGIDEGGWHVEVIMHNDYKNPHSITYSDLDEAMDDMQKLADGIRYGQKVISLQDGPITDDTDTESVS